MKFLKTFLAALLAVIAGSFLTGILWLLVLVGIAGSMDTPTVVAPNSILVIDLNEDITDTPNNNPFTQIDFSTMNVRTSLSLYSALRAIDAAKDDDRIKGIYLRPNGTGAVSATTLEELRAAVEEFKESGKFVVSYNETYSQFGYYLASVADKIYMQPEGGMMWQGLTFNLAFYKGLLDKLEIQPEIFRPTACKYKSAVEPYFLTRMSDANRHQMSELAESMWATVTEAVSQSRGISVRRLNKLADELAINLPEDAVKYGFVDSLIYEDEMNAIFAEYGVEADKKGEYEFVTLGEYASQVAADTNFSADKIAVVYAEGQIVDGEGSGEEIYGNTLAETIKSVRLDDKVKAVVVRVNSPGGSALASDIIWREMELLKAEKPVVVSMGSYAASGGYYISAPADVIVADRLTLTGSIGVFGMFMNYGKLLDNKLGITFDGVNTNAYSDFGSAVRPINYVERNAIMRSVDKVYDRFTGLVSEGRNLPLNKVLDIAGGRVWSGVDAQNIGLADTCGGLKAAIAIAADKAELGDTFRVSEIVEEPEGFMAIFSSLNAQIRERELRNELGDVYSQYRKVKEVLLKNGVQAYCPYQFIFE